MSLTIITTFFDLDDARTYEPLLDRWLLACARVVPGARLIVLTPDDNFPVRLTGNVTFVPRRNVAAEYADVIRRRTVGDARCHAFDLKGALVCEGLLHFGEFLYLDVDAVPVSDPTLWFAALRTCPIAMPADQGARRKAGAKFPSHLPAPFEAVAKHTAGVMWFGAAMSKHQRERMVEDYRDARDRLKPVHGADAPAFAKATARSVCPVGQTEKPYLLEQSAWSLVHHQRRADVYPAVTLPDTMNWPADHLGGNALALIHHFAGGRKWKAAAGIHHEGTKGTKTEAEAA